MHRRRLDLDEIMHNRSARTTVQNCFEEDGVSPPCCWFVMRTRILSAGFTQSLRATLRRNSENRIVSGVLNRGDLASFHFYLCRGGVPFSFFFVSRFFHFLRNLASPYSFSACYFLFSLFSFFSCLTMFHRLLSFTRTFPELVIDCIGSTAARQSTIEMFSRTCCRYLCERLKEYIRQEFYGEFLGLLG